MVLFYQDQKPYDSRRQQLVFAANVISVAPPWAKPSRAAAPSGRICSTRPRRLWISRVTSTARPPVHSGTDPLCDDEVADRVIIHNRQEGGTGGGSGTLEHTQWSGTVTSVPGPLTIFGLYTWAHKALLNLVIPLGLGFYRISAITPLDVSPISRSRELKLTKLAVLLNTLAQRCTSWCYQPRPCVRTPGTKPRGINYLLVGEVVEVRAPRRVTCHLLVFGSSFCGCG